MKKYKLYFHKWTDTVVAEKMEFVGNRYFFYGNKGNVICIWPGDTIIEFFDATLEDLKNQQRKISSNETELD